MNKLRGDKKKYTFTDKTKQDVIYPKKAQKQIHIL